jgi:hypothetical protein
MDLIPSLPAGVPNMSRACGGDAGPGRRKTPFGTTPGMEVGS